MNHFTYSALKSEQLVSSLGMVPCKLLWWSALIHCKPSYGMRMIKVSCVSLAMKRETCFLLTVFVVHWVYQWDKIMPSCKYGRFLKNKTQSVILNWESGEKRNIMKCMWCLHTLCELSVDRQGGNRYQSIYNEHL